MKKRVTLLFPILLLLSLSASALERANMIVAKDGSGDYTKIQDAIDAVPANNTTNVTILVKNGVYEEHLAIAKNFISIVGESRENTKIIISFPRTAWSTAHGTNTGCGVINVAANCHDIVIANMTVKNTWGLPPYADPTVQTQDYTEVLRTEGGTTKIWVVNCIMWAMWSDTFAPWGKQYGMYYATDCIFGGGIDAVCPRGWQYILNSTATETRDSSPYWIEGFAGTTQKLVCQGGEVHSTKNKGVRLQNVQGTNSNFYYLDMVFSDSIAELGKSGASQYFYNIKGKAGLSWFANNLPSTVKHQDINAYWAMDKQWDPENLMPEVMPIASLPQPFHKQYDLSGDITLKFIRARNAVSHNIYFGTTTNPPLVAEKTTAREYTAGTLAQGGYYWRVDAVLEDGSILTGKTWTFGVQQKAPTSIQTIESASSLEIFNQPNGSVFITVSADETQKAQLSIVDINGKRVQNLLNGTLLSGCTNYSSYPLKSGVYIATLSSATGVKSQKFVVK